MTTWITVCDTCKRPDFEARNPGRTDGEKLASLVEQVSNGKVRTRRHACLMGCGKGCNITIQGAGKIGYTLGDFEPTREAAEAIRDYALLHNESETGQIPYRQWPQGVKGHFVSRHPPLPE